jgi:hypothetical protein
MAPLAGALLLHGSLGRRVIPTALPLNNVKARFFLNGSKGWQQIRRKRGFNQDCRMSVLLLRPKFLCWLRFMVLPDRIELSTSPLPRECSTTELRQQARERN